MKIAYLAKHGNGYNDDEGSISYALQKLGHEVKEFQEQTATADEVNNFNPDFTLFHKWYNFEEANKLESIRVFWYFDLVDTPDVTLMRRVQERKNWMKQMTKIVDLGFCTDGDWVNQDKTGKLVRLTQGADERFVGRASSIEHLGTKPRRQTILFTGTKAKAGGKRLSFVQEMQSTYRNQFIHRNRHYQQSLAKLIANSSIVVAPDYPVTDHYWSNRVYMALGFGAFMLHPRCKTLMGHYQGGEDIVYYEDRQHLHTQIQWYLEEPEIRKTIANNALERTKKGHLYRHRCETLIETVKERIL